MNQTKTTPRLRLRPTAAAESAVRGGHPWLFGESILEQNRPGNLGELAVLYDRKNRFLGIGLFDPESPLRVRMLHVGKPRTIDAEWWRARWQAALSRREGWFDARTTGYRCVHGESDGWPGLVLDRYGEVWVLKLYTAAWLPRLNEIADLIQETVRPEQLVLRLSRNMQATAANRFSVSDGQVLLGRAVAQLPTFLETGLRFEADVYRGQKTGFFLDQRENRRLVESLAGGREVLNAFSYTGGFSLYAARGGARGVTDLDQSSYALAGAGRNFALNRDLAGVGDCRHETVQADAFAWFEAPPQRQFDLVILDPPSLAKRQTERAGAINAYAKLLTHGIARLRQDGLLVAASCSAHVSAEEFFELVRQAARSTGRPFQEVVSTTHPPDHPATFPEAWYLKCIVTRFLA